MVSGEFFPPASADTPTTDHGSLSSTSTDPNDHPGAIRLDPAKPGQFRR